jgi:hypothetical protein
VYHILADKDISEFQMEFLLKKRISNGISKYSKHKDILYFEMEEVALVSSVNLL